MRNLIAPALLVGLWLGTPIISAQTHPPISPTALHLVQKIHIGELGTSDEAARFRLLLEDKLAQQGFTVVDTPEKADAVLSGALSVSTVGIYGGMSDVSVTLRLYTLSGERLWGINLPKPVSLVSAFKLRGSLKVKEPVEYRAEELAKELRRDWEKSARAAGIKLRK